MTWAGVLLLGAGLVVMARGVFTSGESRRMLPFAAGSACAMTAYTLTDGIGARIGGDPVGYTGWLLITAAVLSVPVAAGRGGGPPGRPGLGERTGGGGLLLHGLRHRRLQH